jgi:hypothetical protein
MLRSQSKYLIFNLRELTVEEYDNEEDSTGFIIKFNKNTINNVSAPNNNLTNNSETLTSNKNANLIDDFSSIFGGTSETKVNNNTNINNIFGNIDITNSGGVIDFNQNLVSGQPNNNVGNTNNLLSNLGSVIYFLKCL